MPTADIKPNKKVSILFVCLGNICRSPTAEAVFRHLLQDEAPDLDVVVDSAGTHAYHVGDPPDGRAMAAARRRGIVMDDLRGRRVRREDFTTFDLVLAMDEDNLAELRRMAPPECQARIQLFLDYALAAGRREVPDPYYGGETGFEDVLDLVEEAARGLLTALR